MHCAAICPVNAMSFIRKEWAVTDAVIAEKVRELPGGFYEDLKTLVKQRRSYRHFIDKPVDRELITEVLDAARWAPSAKNQQPTKFIVVDSGGIIKKMMDIIVEYVRETGVSPEVATEYEQGNNVVLGDAPTILIAYARDNAINAPGDTYIKMTNIELMFQARGVGTCWGGYFARFLNTVPGLKELLPEIPEGNSFYAAFMLGYPRDESYDRIPARLKNAEITWV